MIHTGQFGNILHYKQLLFTYGFTLEDDEIKPDLLCISKWDADALINKCSTF